MLSKRFQSALAARLPVLFAHIGWANLYAGTERIQGGHGYLKKHPFKNSEAWAFIRGDNGLHHCGVGRGQMPPRAHVVFIARDPKTQTKRLIGVYAAASTLMDGSWAHVSTQHAVLIPVERRPNLWVEWPGDQGIRRWAERATGRTHPQLLEVFKRLPSLLPRLLRKNRRRSESFDQTYFDMEGREGEQYKRLVVHRKREAKLREAKIREALAANAGRLACEVSGCGFDFMERYGPLGYGYAHVHHLIPLSKAKPGGTRKSLADLAIVCANCHAMIHRHGECRDLKSLIPPKRKRSR